MLNWLPPPTTPSSGGRPLWFFHPDHHIAWWPMLLLTTWGKGLWDPTYSMANGELPVREREIQGPPFYMTADARGGEICSSSLALPYFSTAAAPASLQAEEGVKIMVLLHPLRSKGSQVKILAISTIYTEIWGGRGSGIEKSLIYRDPKGSSFGPL